MSDTNVLGDKPMSDDEMERDQYQLPRVPFREGLKHARQILQEQADRASAPRTEDR